MDNKEEKKTAEEIADDIIDNLLCFGMSLPDRIPNRKRIVTALNVYASQQCEALQSENERLKSLIASDSVYWALRNAVKSPSTLGDVEDDSYQDLYNLSCELKKALNPKE
jgi:hypothetical protein